MPNRRTSRRARYRTGSPASTGGLPADLVSRKLATVVHLDIVGYTHHIAADDVGTMARIRRLRVDIVEPQLARRGGQLVQTAGDALLMTFDNIQGAVEFAIDAQRSIHELNLDEPNNTPMLARVGIEISDTILDNTDLHGDGVNIAVRLQSVCPPGGVCISRTVHEHVEGRLAMRFQPLGPLTLKNVRRQVEAFSLDAESLSGGATVASDAGRAAQVVRSAAPQIALPRAPRNSIAVLPFVNIGDDTAQAYFADGVVDDIITSLSHFRSLFVIARNSSFSYRSRDIDVREIARDLCVDYAVEGSIRRTDDRVRLSARLTFAETGAQIWAERFDGEMTDIFSLQDTISARIAAAVEPQIQAAELARSRRMPTESLGAYDFYLRAASLHLEGFSGAACREALRLLGEAMRRDPTFAPAMALSATCHLALHDQGWSEDREHDKAEGLRLAHAALRHGSDDATVLCRAGHTLAGLAADYSGAAELLDRAVELNSNYAEAWMRSGMVRVYLDDPRSAIRHSDRALSLSPRDSRLAVPLCAKGYAFLLLEDYEAAAEMARRSLTLLWKPEMAHRILITALWRLGRNAESQAAAATLLKQIPTFRISEWRKRVSFTQHKRFDIMEIALRDAKLPD